MGWDRIEWDGMGWSGIVLYYGIESSLMLHTVLHCVCR